MFRFLLDGTIPNRAGLLPLQHDWASNFFHFERLHKRRTGCTTYDNSPSVSKRLVGTQSLLQFSTMQNVEHSLCEKAKAAKCGPGCLSKTLSRSNDPFSPGYDTLAA